MAIHTMMKNAFLTIISLALLFLPAAIRAEDAPSADCMTAYENAAYPYWQIVSDVLRFKAMFDNYDRLCSEFYPQDIASLQPAADLLRAKTGEDTKNTAKVIHVLFQDYLPDAVAPACRDDKTARERVRKNLLAAMKTQSRTIGLRLEKSALTLRNPGEDLKLCRDLKPLKKKIEKALGPGLDNPLFEMSVANSKFMTRDARQRKDAFAVYRSILLSLGQDSGQASSEP